MSRAGRQQRSVDPRRRRNVSGDRLYRVAIVGATGAVGSRMLRLLFERRFPAGEIVAFASPRSAGRTLVEGLSVEPLERHRITGFDFAFFSAGASLSQEWAPRFAAAGALVIDNSSAWRMDPDVPLIISEVNATALNATPKRIVANPNCVAMTFLLPLKALHGLFGLKRFVATSYQAAGGAGKKGIKELEGQVNPLFADTDALVDDGASAARSVSHAVHAKPLAFNVVPLVGTVTDDGGYTDEELKMVYESRKILGLPALEVTPTCVRVPVLVGHGVQVRATFSSNVDLEAARTALQSFPGVVLDEIPTPLEWAGRNEVAVGRLRLDLSDARTLNFFAVADNLRKGAALNAIQIAELIHRRGMLGVNGPSTRHVPRPDRA